MGQSQSGETLHASTEQLSHELVWLHLLPAGRLLHVSGQTALSTVVQSRGHGL
jgi:hypothetical protein